MVRKELEEVLKLDITAGAKKAVEEVLRSVGLGEEVPKEEEERIREILTLEADLLDTEAELCERISDVSSQFINDVRSVMRSDFGDLLQNSKQETIRQLEDFDGYVKKRIDAFGKQEI